MARRAREIGESGLYHIYFRAVGNEKIFKSREDCDKFLRTGLTGRTGICL